MTAAEQVANPPHVEAGEGGSREPEWADRFNQLATLVASLTKRVDAVAAWATDAKGVIAKLQEGGGRGCDPLHGHKPTIEGQMALFRALAEWQATCPEFKKDRVATVTTEKSSYSYNYADLGQAAALAHTASKHGLSHFHVQIPGVQHPYIRCYLLHQEGGFIYADAPLIAKNSRGDRGAQDWGAGCTYARRFSLCMVMGIAAAEEDADGEAPSGSSGRSYSSRSATSGQTRVPPQARPATGSNPVTRQAGTQVTRPAPQGSVQALGGKPADTRPAAAAGWNSAPPAGAGNTVAGTRHG